MEFKEMLTPEQYQEQLFQEYNKQTKEELILLCKSTALAEAEKNDEFIHSVLQVVLQKRNITFKQWKALRGFMAKINRNKFSKSF
jgi:hypothetical protein